MKVYLVESQYRIDEYSGSINEKIFLKKEDAIKYMQKLDEEHVNEPQFINSEFLEAFDECQTDIMNSDEYLSSTDYMNAIINEMYKKGFYVTPNMYEQFNDWRDGIEWQNSTVTEYEVCE